MRVGVEVAAAGCDSSVETPGTETTQERHPSGVGPEPLLRSRITAFLEPGPREQQGGGGCHVTPRGEKPSE